MIESRLGYLVKVINIDNTQREEKIITTLDNSFINKFGIISYKYTVFYAFDIILVKTKEIHLFFKNELEILYDEPANNDMFSFCFWCGKATKKIKISNLCEKATYYCPKCLR